MISIQPIAIVADGERDGASQYRVRFATESGEVEHVFTVAHHEGVGDGVNYTDDFWRATNKDPLVKQLCDSILLFHKARQFA